MCIPVICRIMGRWGYAKTKLSFLKICLKTLNEEEPKIRKMKRKKKTAHATFIPISMQRGNGQIHFLPFPPTRGFHCVRNGKKNIKKTG